MKVVDGPATVDFDLLSCSASHAGRDGSTGQHVVARLKELLEKEDEEIIDENQAAGKIFQALSSEQLHGTLRDLEWALKRANSLSYQDFKDREETVAELTETLASSELLKSASDRSRGSQRSLREAGTITSRESSGKSKEGPQQLESGASKS